MASEGKSLLCNFWNDLTNVKLLKAKFLWFTTLFSVVVIYPFLSLHMTTTLGLTERDVGIASSLSAALTIICPFFFGFVADKIGNFKFFLSSLTFLSGVASLLFTQIPTATPTTSLTNSINGTEYLTESASTNITSSDTIVDISFSHQENGNYAMTFWSYLIVRGFFVFVHGGSYTLFEGAMMGYMQEDNLDYGMQRAWGTLAVGISPMVGGKLNEMYGMQVSFCLSAAFFFTTAAALLFFEMDFKKPTKNLCQEIYSQIINAEVIMLLLTMMSVGALLGYIETYLYIFLFKIGADMTLVGLTVAAGIPFEIIIQICATPIVGKIGHVNALVTGVFLYSIRTLGLSFLTNPWWVLPFEILESMTGGLFMTAALMYCTELVTLSSLTSFRGLIGVFYWGIGKLLGSFIGTIIRENIGDRGTFIVMSIFALATSIIYLVAYKIFKKYQSHQKSTQNSTDVTPQKQSKEKQLEKGIDNPAWVDN